MTGNSFNISFGAFSTRIHNPVYRTVLLDINPIANYIYNMRSVLIYSSGPDILWLFIWFVAGIALSALGIRTIYKYENTYVKVMR